MGKQFSQEHEALALYIYMVSGKTSTEIDGADGSLKGLFGHISEKYNLNAQDKNGTRQGYKKGYDCGRFKNGFKGRPVTKEIMRQYTDVYYNYPNIDSFLNEYFGLDDDMWEDFYDDEKDCSGAFSAPKQSPNASFSQSKANYSQTVNNNSQPNYSQPAGNYSSNVNRSFDKPVNSLPSGSGRYWTVGIAIFVGMVIFVFVFGGGFSAAKEKAPSYPPDNGVGYFEDLIKETEKPAAKKYKVEINIDVACVDADVDLDIVFDEKLSNPLGATFNSNEKLLYVELELEEGIHTVGLSFTGDSNSMVRDDFEVKKDGSVNVMVSQVDSKLEVNCYY